MKNKQSMTPKERILDLQNEIQELRILRDEMSSEYSASEMGDNKGGALYVLDTKLRDKLKELARLQVKVIEGYG